MFLPELIDPGASRDQISTFLGINHQLENNAGEWYDELNISSDHYPVMSVRKKRGLHEFKMPEGYEDKAITSAVFNNVWAFICSGKMFIEDVDGKCKIVSGDTEFTGESRIITMGAYCIVFPQGFYYNTINDADCGLIEKMAVGISGNTVGLEACDDNGKPYRRYIDEGKASTAKPENPDNGFIWIDQANSCLYTYSSAQEQWVEQRGKYYTRLYMKDIASMFSVGDSLTISVTDDAPDRIKEDMEKYNSLVVGNKMIYKVIPYDDSIVEDVDDYRKDSIVIACDKYNGFAVYSAQYTLERKLPQLDYVFECNNRLWGCRFGQQTDSAGDIVSDGVIVNAIYASKLGDFKNWRCFEGTSMDSYEASIGEQGPFTGAISYGGYPTFFKQNCVFRVYGMYPAQYSIVTESITGVAPGCGKSLAISGDTLFYQGIDGIYAYTGSLPAKISENLGIEGEFHLGAVLLEKMRTHTNELKEKAESLKARYDELKAQYDALENKDNIVAVMLHMQGVTAKSAWLLARATYNAARVLSVGGPGSDNLLNITGSVNRDKYIIDKEIVEGLSLENVRYQRFVYDIKTGIWHKENIDMPAVGTVRKGNTGYYFDFEERPCVKTYISNEEAPVCEKTIEWYAQTTALGTTDPDRKYVSRIDLRMQLEVGARVMIFIQYDSAGDWNHIATMTGTNLRAFSLPVRLKRCDHFRLRLNGAGDVKIYSITKTIESGSDL